MTTEYVETRMVMLDELTPFPGNARRGNRDKLMESLEENGQYRALVVRQTDDALVVLAGNNTLDALEAKGELEARCEIITCDDATALRVNLVDNKSNDDSGYDDRARAALLELLDGAVSGTGYTYDEADAILARYAEPEITQVQEPAVAGYNDDDEEIRARVRSHGGENSTTYESRGVRDIFLALPAAEADELRRLIMKLLETWGALDQGTVLLKAARLAYRVLGQEPDELTDLDAADRVYAPQKDDEPTDG